MKRALGSIVIAALTIPSTAVLASQQHHHVSHATTMGPAAHDGVDRTHSVPHHARHVTPHHARHVTHVVHHVRHPSPVADHDYAARQLNSQELARIQGSAP
jgi:hypothetical protein